MSRYDAFISYRHGGEDQAVAEELHRLLETFRTPARLVRSGAPPRLSRVFRDREELPTSSSLSDSIVTALEQSRFLIVVCSPRARESRWIAQEIETFSHLGRDDRILTLLIGGEPAEAFPDGLIVSRPVEIRCPEGTPRTVMRLVEPLAADIRAATARERRRLLRTESLRLLAPILGCSYDDLRQRHAERARRRMWAASGALTGLSAVLAGLAIVATAQWQVAEAARAEAAVERDTARATQSRLMARTALRLIEEGDSDAALQLTMEALEGRGYDGAPPHQREAEAALKAALRHHRLAATFRVLGRSIIDMALDGPRGRVVLVLEDGTAELRSIADPATVIRRLARRDPAAGYVRVVAAPSGERFALLSAGGRVEMLSGDLEPVALPVFLPEPPGAVEIVEALDSLLVASDADRGGRVEVRRIADGSLVSVLAESAGAWAVSADRSTVATVEESGLAVTRLDGTASPALVDVGGFGWTESLALDREGAQLVYATGAYEPVTIIRPADPEERIVFRADQYRTWDVTFSPAAYEFGELMVSEGDNGSAIWLLLDGAVSLVRHQRGDLSFLPGGLVASVEPDEAWSSYRLRILDVRPQSRGGFDGEELLRLPLDQGREAPVVGEPSKAYVAVILEDGSAHVYRLADPAVVTASAGSSFEDTLEIATVPDGGRILALAAAGDGGFRLHEIGASLSVTRTAGLELPAGVDEVFGLRVEPGGTRVALQSTRGDVLVYDAATGGAPVVTVPAGREPSPAAFADGRLRVAVRDGDRISVLDLDAGTMVARYEAPGPANWPWLSPDGAILAVATGRRVSAARIGADERLRFLFEAPTSVEDHPAHDGSWGFAGSGKTLCMATADRIWRADLGAGAGAVAGEPEAESRAIVTLLESDGGYCFGVTGSWALTVLGPGGIVEESELRLASELDFGNDIAGVAPFAGGTRLLTLFSERPLVKLLRVEQRTPELLARAHAVASECLTPARREALGLDPAPPARCVESGRWPYDTPEWRAWLSARVNDPAAPLPRSPYEAAPR